MSESLKVISWPGPGGESMGKSATKETKAEIYKRIERLDENDARDVMQFIESIQKKKNKDIEKISFFSFFKQARGSRIGLKALRKRLSGIKGNMSDTVNELRSERG